MVDGGDGPRDADAEEDVDGVGTGDVADGGVGGLVLDGGHLGGEGVCGRDAQSEEHTIREISLKIREQFIEWKISNFQALNKGPLNTVLKLS